MRPGHDGGLHLGVDEGDDALAAGHVERSRRIGEVVLDIDDDERRIGVVAGGPGGRIRVCGRLLGGRVCGRVCGRLLGGGVCGRSLGGRVGGRRLASPFAMVRAPGLLLSQSLGRPFPSLVVLGGVSR
jgi:hypothetical protein